MHNSLQEKREYLKTIEFESIKSLYDEKASLVEKIVDRTSYYVAKIMFLYTNFTANQVSIFRLFVVCVSGLFVLHSEYNFRIIGLFLLLIATMLDFTDGKLAKLRNQKTRLGAFLEDFGDFFTTFYSLTCITIYALNNLNYEDNYLFVLVIASNLFLFRLSSLFHKRYDEKYFKNNNNNNFGLDFKKTINNILINIIYPKSYPYSLFFTIRYLFLFALIFDMVAISLIMILSLSLFRSCIFIYVYVKSLSKTHEIAQKLAVFRQDNQC